MKVKIYQFFIYVFYKLLEFSKFYIYTHTYMLFYLYYGIKMHYVQKQK